MQKEESDLCANEKFRTADHQIIPETPDPDIIAAEIVEDLQAALAQFAEIATDLKR